MELRKNLKLIDSSVRRRASISHALAGSAIHVEPFEDIGEIRMRWPASGVILVEDEDDNIAALLDHMTECGNWLPVVGFSQLPTTSRIVRAILDGAVDYLDWPFGAEEIGEAMVEAEKSVATLGNRKLREAMARSRIERLTNARLARSAVPLHPPYPRPIPQHQLRDRPHRRVQPVRRTPIAAPVHP